jgi:hypothetical protein
MIIDCGACAVRGDACGGCVVTAVLARPRSGVEWDADERAALAALADGGLLPHLQLMPLPSNLSTNLPTNLPSSTWAPRWLRAV